MNLVPEERIELSTYPLPRGCATTTLLRLPSGKRAGPGAITHRPDEGKAMRSSARTEKLAAALKANLKRRKARARALKGGAKGQAGPSAGAASSRPNIAAKEG